MKVSAGSRNSGSSSDRQITFTATGIANNDYLRRANTRITVSYSRMNETMQMLQRMGAQIEEITVGNAVASASAKGDKKQGRKKESN